MIYVILAALALAAICFSIRFYALKHSIREACRELEEIRKEPDQDRILHISVPDRSMEKLLQSMNLTLKEIRSEGQQYRKREKQFQEQIENISHDLRTPQTVILGYLRLLREKEGTEYKGAELEEILGLMERKARFLEQLVSRFYSFSRLTAGDFRLKLCRIDAGRILRETLTDNYRVLQETRLTVDADIPEHPVWIWGEQEALERIFSNLCQNAGRYAESFLRISVNEKKEQTEIHFENDTNRITEEEAEHLFERFFVPDNSEKQGSTGLGLTIARYLAEAMGASLEAELTGAAGSETGKKGSAAGVIRFTLRFSKGQISAISEKD